MGTLSTIFGSFFVWSIGNIGVIHRVVHRHFRRHTSYMHTWKWQYWGHRSCGSSAFMAYTSFDLSATLGSFLLQSIGNQERHNSATSSNILGNSSFGLSAILGSCIVWFIGILVVTHCTVSMIQVPYIVIMVPNIVSCIGNLAGHTY